eukprot:TRINITY_DN15749_c0_g1_i1.p1 TRINITY_DN15749_c0_g1~~TRINITY_DN15749_c0_g1_i1.p1  ORF type:complete len:2282 (+),score=694.24 TRINITY_DN15749_c0_g1_i1:67-6912(+)
MLLSPSCGSSPSRWGSRQDVATPTPPGPSARRQVRRRPPPRRQRSGQNFVLTVPHNGQLSCPCCGRTAAELRATDQTQFAAHLFGCRMEHGHDPTLPVVSLVPTPPEQSPSPQVSMRPHSRPSTVHTSRAPTRPPAEEVLSPTAEVAEDSPAAPVTLCPVDQAPPRSAGSSVSGVRQMAALPPIALDLGKLPARPAPVVRRRQRQVTAMTLRSLRRREQRVGGSSEHAEMLKSLEKATLSNDGVVDVSNYSLRVGDIPALASVVASHPSLSRLRIGSQDSLGPDVTSRGGLVAEALLSAVAASRGPLDDADFGVLESDSAVASQFGDELGAKVRAEQQRAEATQLCQLAEAYSAWRDARQHEVIAVEAEQRVGRADVSRSERSLRRNQMTHFRSTLAKLLHEHRARLLRARKEEQRLGLARVELAVRSRVTAVMIGDLLWLLTQHQNVSRAAGVEAEGTQRRILRVKKDDSRRLAQDRLRARMAREALQRMVVEDAEEEGRMQMQDDEELATSVIMVQAENSWAHIMWLEARRHARADMVGLEHNLRLTLERDEQDSRRWLGERRRDERERREAALLKDREKLRQDELDRRAKIGLKYAAFVKLLQEELIVSVEWVREAVAAEAIEAERSCLMKEPPTVTLQDGLGAALKPFIFFVHPSPHIVEAPRALSASSTAAWGMQESWLQKHRNVSERAKKQSKVLREVTQRMMKVRARNRDALDIQPDSDPFVDTFQFKLPRSPSDGPGSPGLDTPQATLGRGPPAVATPSSDSVGSVKLLPPKRGAAAPMSLEHDSRRQLRVLQNAVKFGRSVREKREKKEPQRPPPTTENLSVEKAKAWGGWIDVSSVHGGEPPGWEADSEVLRCITHLDTVLDGVEFPGSGVPEDTPAEHPKEQFQLPLLSTHELAAVAAVGASAGSLSMAKNRGTCTAERPCGRRMRIVLPSDAPGVLTPELVTRVIRNVMYQYRGHVLTTPHIRRVRITVVLQCSCQPDLMPEQGQPTSLLEATGTVELGIVLAQPFLSLPAGSKNRIEFLEGQRFDELPLLAKGTAVTDPPTITRGGAGTGDFVVMPGGQQGGGLSLTNFHDSYVLVEFVSGFTRDDVVSLRNSHTVWVDGDSVLMKDPIRSEGMVVGKIIRGALPHARVRESQPWFVVHFYCEMNPGLLSGDHLRAFFRGLRFANTSRDPIEGERLIRVQVADRQRYACTVDMVVTVVSKDNPTEMNVPQLKITIRPSTVPAAQRQHLLHSVTAIAEGATVVDVDTDRFVGGYLRVVLGGGNGKGEGLALYLGAKMLTNPVLSATHRFQSMVREAQAQEENTWQAAVGEQEDLDGSLMAAEHATEGIVDQVVGDIEVITASDPLGHHQAGDIIYEGRTIAQLMKGAVLSATADASTAEGSSEVCIEFSRTGMMSIAACEVLLRRIVLVGAVPAVKSGSNSQRTVDINLAIGPTVAHPDTTPTVELPKVPSTYECMLHEKVVVRHAPALLSVPEKYVTADYREGSGAVRLAPFELLQDKHALVDNYNAGYLLIEVVSGSDGDDLITLREDDQVRMHRKMTGKERFESAIGRVRADQSTGRSLSRAMFNIAAAAAAARREEVAGQGGGAEPSAEGSALSSPSGSMRRMKPSAVVTKSGKLAAVTSPIYASPRSSVSLTQTRLKSVFQTREEGEESPLLGPAAAVIAADSAGPPADDPADASSSSPEASLGGSAKGTPRNDPLPPVVITTNDAAAGPSVTSPRSDASSPSNIGSRLLAVAGLSRRSRANTSLLQTPQAKDRMRDRATAEVRERKSRQHSLVDTLQSEARTAMALAKQSMSQRHRVLAFDVFVGGQHVGEARRLGTQVFYIRFKSDARSESITRKQVVTLLRNLTYSNSSGSPGSAKKVFRVCASDSPPGFSQCVVELSLQSVDNVTEIRLQQSRLKYCPTDTVTKDGVTLPFVLCPYGSACLVDADTEHVDGGFVVLSVITGGAKGDTLGFMSVQQQRALFHEDPPHAGHFCPGVLYLLRVADDLKRVYLLPSEEGGEETLVATLHYLDDRTGGLMNGIKVTFAKHPDRQIVPLSLASYCLNCITFSNGAEATRSKPTSRTYLIRVADSVNPQEGKAKLVVDGVLPLCIFLPQGVTSTEIAYDLSASEWVTVFDGRSKLSVCFPGQDTAKPPPLTQGWVHVTIGSSTESSSNAAMPPSPAHGAPEALSLSPASGFCVRDGGLYLGTPSTPVSFLCKVEASSQAYNLEFNWSSKINAKQVQTFLRSILFRATGSLPRRRAVRVRISDGGRPQTCTAFMGISQ